MTLRAALLAVLLALPALGAGPLEALRTGSRAVAEQLKSLRAEQLSRRSELSTLSTRIEALKASAKGRLLPGGELDAALKQSQELSGSLTELARQVTAREGELEAANVALVEALSAELTRLRSEFDRQTDRAARRATIEAMKRVRAEREAMRAALPATRLPTLDTLKPSDDPEVLLEQADLLRDSEEKLTRDLKALETRLDERKQEAELDRHLQRFLGEESAFDDQDRRLRVQRTTQLQGAAPTLGGAGPGRNNSTGNGVSTDVAGSPGQTGSFGFNPAAAGRDAAPPAAPPVSGGVDSGGVRKTEGSDARPQVGKGKATIATGDDDDINDLEVQRAKVKALVDELRAKAAELEKRAAELK